MALSGHSFGRGGEPEEGRGPQPKGGGTREGRAVLPTALPALQPVPGVVGVTQVVLGQNPPPRQVLNSDYVFRCRLQGGADTWQTHRCHLSCEYLVPNPKGPDCGWTGKPGTKTKAILAQPPAPHLPQGDSPPTAGRPRALPGSLYLSNVCGPKVGCHQQSHVPQVVDEVLEALPELQHQKGARCWRVCVGGGEQRNRCMKREMAAVLWEDVGGSPLAGQSANSHQGQGRAVPKVSCCRRKEGQCQQAQGLEGPRREWQTTGQGDRETIQAIHRH